MDWNDAEWHLQAAAADPFTVSVAEVGLSTSPTHARTQSIMPIGHGSLVVQLGVRTGITHSRPASPSDERERSAGPRDRESEADGM